jgi:hypothetical protein
MMSTDAARAGEHPHKAANRTTARIPARMQPFSATPRAPSNEIPAVAASRADLKQSRHAVAAHGSDHPRGQPAAARGVERSVRAKEPGRAGRSGRAAKLSAEATRACVTRQLDAGIDVGNDGEQSRGSFFTHVTERMTGFGGARTGR